MREQSTGGHRALHLAIFLGVLLYSQYAN
jgi:hypothetical protein